MSMQDHTTRQARCQDCGRVMTRAASCTIAYLKDDHGQAPSHTAEGPHCGRPFERYPSRVTRFCSRTCEAAAGHPHPARDYPLLQRDFFRTIDTPQKAYILGFITADGSINSNGRGFTIGIAQRDHVLLEQIQTILGGGGLRVKRSAGGYAPGRCLILLQVCSSSMVHDLAALGVGRKKTHTATYPSLRPEVERDFVRGLYDGDGWIGKRQFMLVGTDALLRGVQAAVLRHTRCLLTPSLKGGWPYLTGSRRDRAVLSWMYEGAALALGRKQQAWRTYWAAQEGDP